LLRVAAAVEKAAVKLVETVAVVRVDFVQL
jgi:hypothetical protein